MGTHFKILGNIYNHVDVHPVLYQVPLKKHFMKVCLLQWKRNSILMGISNITHTTMFVVPTTPNLKVILHVTWNMILEYLVMEIAQALVIHLPKQDTRDTPCIWPILNLRAQEESYLHHPSPNCAASLYELKKAGCNQLLSMKRPNQRDYTSMF